MASKENLPPIQEVWHNPHSGRQGLRIDIEDTQLFLETSAIGLTDKDIEQALEEFIEEHPDHA